MVKYLYVALIVCCAATGAWAIDPSPQIAKPRSGAPVNIPSQDVNTPATIKADNMFYDPQTHIVEASGHVEISQDKRILFADKIIYNQKTSEVIATGNVSVLEPSGQVYFAESVKLDKEMKTGVIKDFKAVLIDKSRFAANSAERVSDTVSKLRQAVYSPCDVCREKPDKAPLWQIKADRVKIDENKEEVMYHDAWLEFFGEPVLYTPYLSHSTPGAGNESGFLMPIYRNTTIFGPSLQVPYYFSIAPNMDLTLAPIFNSNQGDVMTGEFRHLTETGGYKLKGSITNPPKLDNSGNPIGGDEIRGHVEGVGKFDLENDWAWGFSGKRASDDTYLSRYRFGGETTLTSTIYANQMRNRDFMEARAITFQTLTAGNDSSITPLVLPVLQTHVESAPGYMGSRYTLDANTTTVTREKGANSEKLSIMGEYNLPVITPSGSLFKFDAKMRGDAYAVQNMGYDGQSDTPGRLIPELDAQWSYPLIQRLQNGNLSLEPIVGLMLSPYGGNPKTIPNEDSQNYELNELNVFSSDKYTGLDKVEDGPRANYGFRTNYITDSNKNLGLLLAESYRLRTTSAPSDTIGVEPGQSSYVGRLDASDNHYVDFAYSFRFSEKYNHFERNEISSTFNFQPISLNVDYIFLNDEFNTLGGDREEVVGNAAYELTQEWKLIGNIRRGLGDKPENGGLISSGLGLLFKNECLSLSLILNREYTRDRDIPPSTSVTFQLALKNLD